MPNGKSNKKRKAHFPASGTRKAWAEDPEKGIGSTKQAPEKRSSATVTKDTVTVPAASVPRTPVPQKIITAGAAVLSSGPAVPYPAVPSPAFDSIAAEVFTSPALFDLTNDDDDIPGPLNTIWEDSHCEICSDNYKQVWKCLWCGHFQKVRHHTRSVRHFAKHKGGGISA